MPTVGRIGADQAEDVRTVPLEALGRRCANRRHSSTTTCQTGLTRLARTLTPAFGASGCIRRGRAVSPFPNVAASCPRPVMVTECRRWCPQCRYPDTRSLAASCPTCDGIDHEGEASESCSIVYCPQALRVASWRARPPHSGLTCFCPRKASLFRARHEKFLHLRRQVWRWPRELKRDR